MRRDPDDDRERLARARLMLLFTPAACGRKDPRAVLEELLPHVDVVQIRPKALGDSGLAPCSAAETLRWARTALALRDALAPGVLVIVDDRVDVARVLLGEGVSGVHLGRDDAPVELARAFLGERAIVGCSTHDMDQVLEADESAADYLGFGPVNATPTKGYARGLGAEAAWIASRSTSKPLFPIGGVARENAQELARVGRAVVGSALLVADDPARAAHELRELLEGDADER